MECPMQTWISTKDGKYECGMSTRNAVWPLRFHANHPILMIIVRRCGCGWFGLCWVWRWNSHTEVSIRNCVCVFGCYLLCIINCISYDHIHPSHKHPSLSFFDYRIILTRFVIGKILSCPFQRPARAREDPRIQDTEPTNQNVLRFSSLTLDATPLVLQFQKNSRV
jgi:hypothetical protein